MKSLSILFALSIIFSCSQTEKIHLDDAIFLHDNSSKVWLVEKVQIKDRNYVPLKFQEKLIYVFHVTGNCYENTVKNFGDAPGAKLNFSVDRETNSFELGDHKAHRKFKIKYFSREKIVIWAKDKTDTTRIEMIPFPEY